MSAVSAPPASASAAAPIITCPYTAGGCPLFNTLPIDSLTPASPRCAGSCAPSPAPAPSTSAAASTSASTPSTDHTPLSSYDRRPSISRGSSAHNPIAYDNSALLFSALQSDVPLPLPSALLKQDAWSSYLDFAVSPGSVDLPSFYSPSLPDPSSAPTDDHRSSLPPLPLRQSLANSSKHNLWDIEELVPASSNEGGGHKRTRLTPPPPVASTSSGTGRGVSQEAYGAGGGAMSAAMAAGVGAGAVYDLPSPGPSSDEEKEVVTPFISKLTYLLGHKEYEPWVRFDASGQHILIAHTKNHLLEILARYFRHTTVASFVRQLNIYGFKRASTSNLLGILDTVSFPSSVMVPGHTEPETFSAADYSAFSNPAFFRSSHGHHCRLGALKPITKERGPRNRSKKAQKKKQTDSDEST